MKKLRILTPDKYLSFRLDVLLRKWQRAKRTSERQMRPMSQTVFEAITTNDEQFFNICSIELLMDRLAKAVDQNFKVSWFVQLMVERFYVFHFCISLSLAGAWYVDCIECNHYIRGTTHRWTEDDQTKDDQLYTSAAMPNNQYISIRTISVAGIQMGSHSKYVICVIRWMHNTVPFHMLHY